MRPDNDFFIAENIDTGRSRSANWVEDNLASSFNHGSGRADFLSLSLSEKKMKIFLWFLFFGVALLLGRSFHLQIIRGGEYFSLAEDNRIRTKYVKAQRGIFYDRNGEILVRNISGFSLFITPADLPKNSQDQEAILQKTADIVGIPIAVIKNKFSDQKYYFQPIPVITGIDYERAMALKIASADLPGISLESDNWRQYLGGDSFSHIFGYVGKINAEEYERDKNGYLLSDNIGKTGLEQSYEKILRGQYGKKMVEVDALGREKKIVARTDFVPGHSLVLSIDAKLQQKIYEILSEKLKNQKNASVIVSNPQNGELLALVDYPGYDGNLFATGISQEDYDKLIADERKPLFMRSIFGEYPSGSTVKMVVAAAALAEGIADQNTSISSAGGIWVGNQWFFPDWKAGGHGATNVTKAIAESVNTYFYYVGGGYGDFRGLGVGLLTKYMKLFGLGGVSGIDLPGERSGFVPSAAWKEETKNEVWYIGDTYHLAIGQGDLLVTPLQVNVYTAAIANGGTLYQPRVVKEIINENGPKEMIMPKVIRENFVSRENINIVRAGMRQAVVSGSARGLNSLPVAVAGKTGTAQWSSAKSNHAWFTAFAPYDNPTFAITVLVEAGGEGSSAAAPIAKEILEFWFKR